MSIAQLQWVVLKLTILPLGKLLDFSETGIDTELPFGLVLEKFSSQEVIQSLELFSEFQSKTGGFLSWIPHAEPLLGKIPF